jgi:hypothetical protein
MLFTMRATFGSSTAINSGSGVAVGFGIAVGGLGVAVGPGVDSAHPARERDTTHMSTAFTDRWFIKALLQE